MNLYAYVDADGAAVAAAPAFETAWQRVDTPEESAFALAPLGSFVPCVISHRLADVEGYDDDLLARWKIARIAIPDAPEGKVLAGHALALTDGEVTASFDFEDTPPAVPTQVTRRQGKLALHAAGLLAEVKALVAAADPETQIYFDDSEAWRRDSSILAALAAQLSTPLSESEIDALFIDAAAR